MSPLLVEKKKCPWWILHWNDLFHATPSQKRHQISNVLLFGVLTNDRCNSTLTKSKPPFLNVQQLELYCLITYLFFLLIKEPENSIRLMFYGSSASNSDRMPNLNISKNLKKVHTICLLEKYTISAFWWSHHLVLLPVHIYLPETLSGNLCKALFCDMDGWAICLFFSLAVCWAKTLLISYCCRWIKKHVWISQEIRPGPSCCLCKMLAHKDPDSLFPYNLLVTFLCFLADISR